jgi:hypothetical protein
MITKKETVEVVKKDIAVLALALLELFKTRTLTPTVMTSILIEIVKRNAPDSYIDVNPLVQKE